VPHRVVCCCQLKKNCASCLETFFSTYVVRATSWSRDGSLLPHLLSELSINGIPSDNLTVRINPLILSSGPNNSLAGLQIKRKIHHERREL